MFNFFKKFKTQYRVKEHTCDKGIWLIQKKEYGKDWTFHTGYFCSEQDATNQMNGKSNKKISGINSWLPMNLKYS